MSETSKKAQKLASAIYFLTGFFAEQEPSKWKLRSLALDLSSEKGKDKSAIAKEIVTVLGLAQTAGIISTPNHDILVAELAKLGSETEDSLRGILATDVVAMENTLPEPINRTERVDRTEYLRDRVAEEPKKYLLEVKKDKPLKEFGAVSVKKNSRQSTIIGLLKRKKEIMIKDVAPLIEGCSEKTIQRELLAMVATGILKKIGEKRWSRYSLA